MYSCREGFERKEDKFVLGIYIGSWVGFGVVE